MCVCVCVRPAAGYPPFLPQMPPHVGLPPELCPRELLPLSAAAAAALGSVSPGAAVPYASRPSLVPNSYACIHTQKSKPSDKICYVKKVPYPSPIDNNMVRKNFSYRMGRLKSRDLTSRNHQNCGD